MDAAAIRVPRRSRKGTRAAFTVSGTISGGSAACCNSGTSGSWGATCIFANEGAGTGPRWLCVRNASKKWVVRNTTFKHWRKIKSMPEDSEEFYRIQKLPPYVFAVINEMRARARAAQIDVIDLGMGNPDGATPRPIVNKLIEAARNARNHRYSQSRGIPKLREEIARRYKANYDVDLDPDTEAIVTIGAKDALAHLLFAIIGPGDVVVSPNPAYPIHQYGVIMAECEAHMLPMPDAVTFLHGLKDRYKSSVKPKVILISFPHNPTAVCVDLAFM